MREAGVVAGLPLLAAVFAELDPALEVELCAADGAHVTAGAVVARLHGSAHAILAGERVALNLLQRLCGIATLTARYVAAVGDLPALGCDELLHDAQPLRRTFRIRHGAFDWRDVEFREEQSLGVPVQDLVVDRLLGPDVRRQDPDAFSGHPGQHGAEKRVGRFVHVVEYCRCAGLHNAQPSAHRRSIGNAFQ
jgi:hypothetical protein